MAGQGRLASGYSGAEFIVSAVSHWGQAGAAEWVLSPSSFSFTPSLWDAAAHIQGVSSFLTNMPAVIPNLAKVTVKTNTTHLLTIFLKCRCLHLLGE